MKPVDTKIDLLKQWNKDSIDSVNYLIHDTITELYYCNNYTTPNFKMLKNRFYLLCSVLDNIEKSDLLLEDTEED